jgi:hypothetical protein
MARSPQVLELFQTTAALAHCLQHVAEAGCCIQPLWAAGAKLLVPLTAEHLAEAGIELSYDHVVALASDVDAVKAALKELSCKGKTRPKLAAADIPLGSKRARCENAAASSASPFVNEDGTTFAIDQIDDELADPDGPDGCDVEVEVVNSIALRTDSSLGLPVYPYVG